MIKLIVFDLDGVLVDSREMHYQALNKALMTVDKQYVISREEHLSTYDGLTTTKKLQKLTETKGLPKELHSEIWKKKQEMTNEAIKDVFTLDIRKCRMFEALRKEGYKIAVASNAITDTVTAILYELGLARYINHAYSNEDVTQPKPHPEVYLKAMHVANVSPQETLIIEDSHIGRLAAQASGAHLLAVRNPDEVSYQLIKEYIARLEKGAQMPKWKGGSLNIVIPMAGAGRRFAEVGFTFPKPLVPVNKFDGKPMIQVVVENLNIEARYIFIVQKEHYEKYSLQYLLRLIAPNCIIVQTDGVTEGAACSVLLAKEHINNDNPLLISDSDHFIEWNSNEFMYSMGADMIDGGLATFTGTHPKWSYCRLNDEGYVVEVAEKKIISTNANVGRYYWTRGSEFVKYAEQMIQKNVRVNNEFYVAPVYNEAIEDGKKIKIFPVRHMWGLGTPEDLAYFERYYEYEKTMQSVL